MSLLKNIGKTATVIVLITIVIFYFTFRNNGETERPDDKIKSNKKSRYIFYSKGKQSNKPHQISSDYVPTPYNEKMSMSVFIKVNNWYENFDSWKHILHKGTNMAPEDSITFKALKYQSPGLWFFPKINNLRFVLSVYSDFKFKHKYCDIENVPIGTYFHIAFTVNNNIITVFLNGKMVKNCIFEGIPILTEGNIYVNQGITYNGEIKKLQFFDDVITVNEISKLSRL